MAYLYGNSEPFEQQYDAVTALEGLMSGAAEALRVGAEASALHARLEESRARREADLAALGAFHEAVLAALQKLVTDTSPPQVNEYVRDLSQHAGGLLERLCDETKAAAAQEEQQARAALEAHRTELRRILAAILVKLKLPVESSTVTMRLLGGRTELSARLTCPEGVEVDARLAASVLPEWQSPRRVLDFVAGLHLPLDVKKGWLSPTVQNETVPVGDYILGGFVVGDDAAELRLRRKAIEDDVVVVELRRDGDETVAKLRRPGARAAEGSDDGEHPVDPSARKLLGELWAALVEATKPALDRLDEVLAVRLDGHDVVAGDHVPALIRAVVKLFAPTVAAIDEKTPTDGELALKYETEAGRRQEIYVTKAKLSGLLVGLGAEDLELFAPLEPFGIVPEPPPASPPADEPEPPDDAP